MFSQTPLGSASTSAHNADPAAHGLSFRHLSSVFTSAQSVYDYYSAAATGVTAYTTDDAALSVSYNMQPYTNWKQIFSYQNDGTFGRTFTPIVGGVEFITDSQSVCAVVQHGGQTFNTRAWVDGRPVQTTLTVSAGVGYLRLVFQTSGMRRVAFEMSNYGLWNNIKVMANCRVFPSEKRPIIAVIGDSNGQGGAVAQSSYNGYAYNLSRILGLDLKNDSIGSTGYIAGASNYGVRFEAAVTGPGNNPADVILFQSSTNDLTYTNAQIRTAARALWVRARSLKPNALIIVTGYFGTSTFDQSRVTAEAEIQAEFNLWGDPMSIFVPTVAWLTGTGTASSPSGSGNNDMYSHDGVHLTDSGAMYMARIIAHSIIEQVSSKYPR